MDKGRLTPEAKLICKWILTVFLVWIALVFMPSFSSLFALISAAFIVPIRKWQNILRKYTGKFIKGRIRTAVITTMAVLAVLTIPAGSSFERSDVKETALTPNRSLQSSSAMTSSSTETTITPDEDITREAEEFSNNTMVWIPTKGGKKYHSSQWCSSMDSPEHVTLKEAEDRGFTPCKRCY